MLQRYCPKNLFTIPKSVRLQLEVKIYPFGYGTQIG